MRKAKVLVSILLCTMFVSCATVTINEVTEEDKILGFAVAGSALAIIFLSQEDEQERTIIEIATRGAIDMLESEELTVLIPNIIQFIEDYADDSSTVDRYGPFVIGALEILRASLTVDFTIKSEYKRIQNYVEAFLQGALAGIVELKNAD